MKQSVSSEIFTLAVSLFETSLNEGKANSDAVANHANEQLLSGVRKINTKHDKAALMNALLRLQHLTATQNSAP